MPRKPIGRTLIDASTDTIPVCVINMSDSNKTQYKDTSLGLQSPVREVSNAITDVTDGMGTVWSRQTAHWKFPVKTKLPDHLTELFDRCSNSLDQIQTDQFKQLLLDFQDIFSSGPTDLGSCGFVKHKIDTGDAKPIRLPPRVPMHLQNEVDAKIQKLLDAKVIQRSNPPWSSCIVAVRKKNGSLRICQDFRALNEVTVKDSYPLPRIDTCLEHMQGSCWFSTVDLASGFHQI